MLNKLKQFKDLRSQAKKLQEELSKESVSVTAAGSDFELTMNGNMEVTDIRIEDNLLDPKKKEKLQKAIKEAHKDALKKIQTRMAMKMKDMGGFPGLSDLA